VLEVKCPLSCSHTKPSEETVDCLIKLNDRVELNKNHKYMDQIQGQMALTGCTKGDFFVFGRHFTAIYCGRSVLMSIDGTIYVFKFFIIL